MKFKTLLIASFAALSLTSCDDDNNSPAGANPGPGNGGINPQIGGERSVVGERVRFVGTSESTSTSNAGGFSVTTTTNSSTDIIDEFAANGTVVSNGTVTIDSISSTIGPVPGAGQTAQVVNDVSTYSFTLAADKQSATLISFDDSGAQFEATLTYTSDTTGTYLQTSDQTISGIRLVTRETGTFEILD